MTFCPKSAFSNQDTSCNQPPEIYSWSIFFTELGVEEQLGVKAEHRSHCHTVKMNTLYLINKIEATDYN